MWLLTEGLRTDLIDYLIDYPIDGVMSPTIVSPNIMSPWYHRT